MNNRQISQQLRNLDARRRALGMSYAVLSARSGVPLASTKRILGGRQRSASFASVSALAEALGAGFQFQRTAGVEEFRERQARHRAEQLVGMVQGTSGLEAQAVDPEALEQMIRRTTHELLAGPKRRLWASR
jgi:hypothetical protein